MISDSRELERENRERERVGAMREEEEPSWFARWEEELPSPEELTPISQTLITPDLALAFNIPSSPTAFSAAMADHPNLHRRHHHTPPSPPESTPPPPQTHHHHNYLDSPELVGDGSDEPTRTLKRPRLVWTPQLHKRFVDAVGQLGIKNAVPKTIMQLMRVDGLTRENVASHLQKYRLYLKRMQQQQHQQHGGGFSHSSGAAGGLHLSAADADADRLFATTPLPHHFVPFAPPVAAMQQQQQHHPQMAAVAHLSPPPPYYHHNRQVGPMGSPPGGGFEHGVFMTRPQMQLGMQGLVGPAREGVISPLTSGSYVDDKSEYRGGGRKVLTLFPTGED